MLPDAVSVEATDMGGGRETHGLAGIHGKHDWWDGDHHHPWADRRRAVRAWR